MESLSAHALRPVLLKQGSFLHCTSILIVATPVEEPKKEEPKPTGKYVPPSQRAAAAAGGTTTPSGPTVPSHLRRKKEMPILKSEEEFPTLGGNAPPIPVDRYVLSVVCFFCSKAYAF